MWDGGGNKNEGKFRRELKKGGGGGGGRGSVLDMGASWGNSKH